MTTSEFDDTVDSVKDDLTLSEYIASLSAEDKMLITDLSIDIVGELLLFEVDDFDDLINKPRPDLDQQQQNRRIEIIRRISDLQAFEKAFEGGRKHPDFKGGNGNGNGKKRGKQNKPKDDSSGEEQQQPKRQSTAYKYSNKGRCPLFEAIILAGRPAFLKYVGGDSGAGNIESCDTIEEDNRTIRPPHPEHYPYDPYEFENMNEVFGYLERAKKETIGSLYKQAKEIASNYNDQNKQKVQLLAVDMVWTYFQDRFPTTHYEIILGSPGSGKSSYGETFAATGYRVVNLTDPNAANINRIAGTIEPGQCTFVSDETGPLDRHPDLMSLLKTGYSIKGKTSKINDYSRVPEFFYTYGFKMIIAERKTPFYTICIKTLLAKD